MYDSDGQFSVKVDRVGAGLEHFRLHVQVFYCNSI